jgi:hypothetical protein
MFQILQSVIYDLYLLLNHWHTVREVIMLRDSVLKLLQTVIRKF